LCISDTIYCCCEDVVWLQAGDAIRGGVAGGGGGTADKNRHSPFINFYDRCRALSSKECAKSLLHRTFTAPRPTTLENSRITRVGLHGAVRPTNTQPSTDIAISQNRLIILLTIIFTTSMFLLILRDQCHLVNAYEVEAGVVLFAGKTV